MPRLNKLRRVDFSVHVYDRNAGYREILLMFFEGKGQYARNDAKEAVEGQGFNACQTYVSSDRAASTTVNCLCVIGTIARAFQLLPGPIWRPFLAMTARSTSVSISMRTIPRVRKSGQLLTR